MHRNVYESELSKQLTPSLKQDEAIVRVFQAVDKELQEIAQRQQLLYLIANIDNLPEKIIRLLAWQWHVDFWDETLPLEKKRELVKNSIAWHRHKGTPWAVEQVVTAAVADATIEEWFEYGGDPYMFRIQTSGFKEENTFQNLISAINSVKNTRSHLEKIIIDVNKEKDNEENKLKYTAGVVNCTIGRKQVGIATPEKSIIPMTVGIASMKAGKKSIGLSPPPAVGQKIYVGQYICRTGQIEIGGIR